MYKNENFSNEVVHDEIRHRFIIITPKDVNTIRAEDSEYFNKTLE